MKRHTDPSDITVNLCLDRSENLEGSHVLFFGSKDIRGIVDINNAQTSDPGSSSFETAKKANFRVAAKKGWASIHWGQHPHMVTSLEKGQRTNVVLTYCFVEASRSLAMKSACFHDESSST